MSGTLVFAGGGTGGHVFPMVAVAEAVRRLSSDTSLVFVGTERGIETRVIPERGWALELLEVLPIRGGGARGAVRGAIKAAGVLPAARRLLRAHAPDAVFSVGGYAAGPVTLAARTLGIPVALLEPNSAIGLANRLIAPLVQRAYLAFDEAGRFFGRGVATRTGVPIREGFEPRPFSFHPGEPLRILLAGGSQGAQALNEALPEALSRVKAPVTVVHQAGRGKEAPVSEAYRRLGLGERAEVLSFIDDMPARIAAAHLVVGRAGASAVAEICAVGRPSLLVPYPFAGDHQRHNAESLARQGAARCILAAEATAERLAAEIEALATDPTALADMAEQAQAIGRPEAASAIARDLLELAGESKARRDRSSKADPSGPGSSAVHLSVTEGA